MRLDCDDGESPNYKYINGTMAMYGQLVHGMENHREWRTAWHGNTEHKLLIATFVLPRGGGAVTVTVTETVA